MKKFSACFLIFLALANSGCVPSLHPFYSEGDVYFEKCLVGKWVDREYKFTWQFERRGHKAYRLTQTDEDGEETVFEATLFKLSGRTFLDAAPIRSKNDLRSNMMRTHSLIAVSIENERLRIASMDPGWLKEQLSRFPEMLSHTQVDNEMIITDTTENIQSFIRRSLNAPGAFGAVDEVVKQVEAR
jgi:hypothetical protein